MNTWLLILVKAYHNLIQTFIFLSLDSFIDIDMLLDHTNIEIISGTSLYNHNYDYDRLRSYISKNISRYKFVYNSLRISSTINIILPLRILFNIYPISNLGKLFCMLYSLIGIPLLLVFMAQIGDLMANAFRWMYR